MRRAGRRGIFALLKTEVELPENTYEGVGKGIGGEVKVWLEVVDGKMVSLTVTEQSETDFVARPRAGKDPGRNSGGSVL